MNHNNQQPGSADECRACEGSGYIETGIEESPTTQCRKCEGTGFAPAVEQSAEKVATIDTPEFRELMQNFGYWTEDEDDDCSRDLVAYIEKHTRDAIAASRRTTGGDVVVAYLATDLDGRGDGAFTVEEAKRRAGYGCDTIIPLGDLAAPVSESRTAGDVFGLCMLVAEAAHRAATGGKAMPSDEVRAIVSEVLATPAPVSAGQAVQVAMPDLSKLTRYELKTGRGMLSGREIHEMGEDDDGEYVRIFDVQELFAAPVSPPDGAMPEQDNMRKVLVNVRNALQFANDSPGGGISDTLWMMDQPETIFDYIDAALAAQPAEGSAQVDRRYTQQDMERFAKHCMDARDERRGAAPERSDTPAPCEDTVTSDSALAAIRHVHKHNGPGRYFEAVEMLVDAGPRIDGDKQGAQGDENGAG